MAIIKIINRVIIVFIITAISACGTTPSRYQQKHDSIPSRLPTNSELHDATPRAEVHSRGGNKHYQVRGKHYQVMKSAENFSQTGIASWYGKKFHGHLTSNGEIYDMYAMSAAHKNLPLPTYLKVVNNANGLSVIVRVNDRGPFHQSRIIDLSYSAAYKLDMLKTGTANVTITAITDFSASALATLNSNHTSATAKVTPLTNELKTEKLANQIVSNAVNTSPKTATTPAIVSTQPTTIAVPKATNKTSKSSEYIQVFASQSNSQAQKLANALSSLHQQNTQLEQINGIFRVLIGPIKKPDELAKVLLSIKDNGYPNAFIRPIE